MATKFVSDRKEIFFNSAQIDFFRPFERMTMIEAVRKYSGIDFSRFSDDFDFSQVSELASNHGIKLEPFQNTIGHILLAFFEEYAEKKLLQPTFIYDYPISVSPLAKSKPNDSKVADRFELFIAGLEFANGYSELNDAEEQKKRFQQQVKQKDLGNEEISSFDQDFVEALEYGMPEAGGLGIGIDRVVMLFTGEESIKEVIAFPQLKEKITERQKK